ncbi:hypothetical protein BX600DRAFT_467661 [Xylariales sp. PMI_506]|nr:hypothetical protein BX600DRAFT_467661 [Xylariales sp. PMI_506]
MAAQPTLIPGRGSDKEAQEDQFVKFVNITGSARLDDVARTTIRAESLRDYHKKRRANAGLLERGLSSPQSQKGSNGRFQRFSLNPEGLKPTQRQPQPKYTGTRQDKPAQSIKQPALIGKAVGKRTFDPFDALPLPSTPRIRLLVYQLLSRVSSNSPTIDYRKAWFDYALKDLAFFYIALAQSAADAGLTLKRGDSLEAIAYQNNGIRLLQKRIEHPAACCDDSTIATVAALASYEATNGSLEAARSHLNGLERLVQMRGGLHARSNGLLGTKVARLARWADMFAADHLEEPPRFPPPPTSSAKKDISEIFAQLRKFAAAKAAQQFITLTGDEENSPGDEMYVLQRKLGDISTNRPNQKSDNSMMIRVWAVAALIFMHTALCDTTFDSRIVMILVSKLPKYMKLMVGAPNNLASALRDEDARRKTLWALTLGAIASEWTEQRRCLVELIRVIRKHFDQDLSIMDEGLWLREILWDSSFDVPLQKLLQEINFNGGK